MLDPIDDDEVEGVDDKGGEVAGDVEAEAAVDPSAA